MKDILLCLVAFFTLTAYAQRGAWSGEISVQGMKIVMVLHLDDGHATLDVPTQGAKDIPAELTRNADGSILVSIPVIDASYEGKLEGNVVKGTFKQHGMVFPMNLTSGVKKANRPQTPKAPFPYTTEEVTFSNGSATLSGTLTLPHGCNRLTPAVVMVTGSGLQDRNETIFEHQPFYVIADAFARQGIATLRYDDRGFAKSTGDIVNCTTADLKNDALAGVRLLRQRFNHVGVLGHSEGGTIAMMLAAEGNADFIISLAGAVVSGKEMLLQQNRYALTTAGLPQETVNGYCKALAMAFDMLEQGKPAAGIKPEGITDQALKANFQAAVAQSSTPYMRYFLKLAGADYLSKIHCPVMALNGTLDRQVDYKANLEALRKGLKVKNSRIEAKEGLNHLFQHCQTGDMTEYQQIEETFSNDVINEMIAWVKAL